MPPLGQREGNGKRSKRQIGKRVRRTELDWIGHSLFSYSIRNKHYYHLLRRCSSTHIHTSYTHTHIVSLVSPFTASCALACLCLSLSIAVVAKKNINSMTFFSFKVNGHSLPWVVNEWMKWVTSNGTDGRSRNWQQLSPQSRKEKKGRQRGTQTTREPIPLFLLLFLPWKTVEPFFFFFFLFD